MKKLVSLAFLPLVSFSGGSFALEALPDEALSAMTGQAGVTIELDTFVTLDALTYTDTDTGGAVQIGGVVIGGGAIGGGPGDSRLDNLKIEIDVSAEGNLVLHHESIDMIGMLNGSNGTDFGLHVDYVDVLGMNGVSTLASDINIAGVIGPGDLIVFNDNANGFINTQNYFEIKNGSLNIDVMGVGVSNLRIFQDDNPFTSATYTDKDGVEVSKWTDWTTDVQVDVDGNGTFDVSAAQYAADNGNDQMVFSAITVGTASSADGLVSDALYFRSDSAVLDMSMNVGIGNASQNNLGYIELQNIDITGTEMIVYGH